jgi:hydroxymethylglutaryl-CoA reductase
MERSSELSGFYKLSIDARRAKLREWAGLTEAELASYAFPPGIDPALVDRMIENVVGVFPLPLGIATNFRVNGTDYLVPMAIEEPSVVAAASNSAKVTRATGGFRAQTTAPVMIGQVQLLEVPDPSAARLRILAEREKLLEQANAKDPMLVKFGGGARDLEVRIVPSPRGTMLVVHLLVDARDAGGMNAVNTMCEALAPTLARLAGGRAVLRIISNLAVLRLARAWATFPAAQLATSDMTGPQVVEAILDAYTLAVVDPFRCATHNKGIMNGISAVVVATGNDFRAIESGAHTYAAFRAREGGVVAPLTTFEKDRAGDLVGSVELPVAVGLVGGATAVHPTAKANVKLLGVRGAGRRPGAELWRSPGPGHRGHPAGAHGAARAEHRHDGGRPARGGRSRRRPPRRRARDPDRSRPGDPARAAGPGPGMKIGILALQGDVPEHRAALAGLVAPEDIVEVRRTAQLETVDALLMPGGESTTMARLLRDTEIFDPLLARLRAGLPVLATCAGLILLSRQIAPLGEGSTAPETMDVLGVTVRRNDYGRQADSFEAPVRCPLAGDAPFPGVFIRAPRILEVAGDTEPIARRGEEIVGVRRGNAWGFAFHPELARDDRIHRAWIASFDRRAAQRTGQNSATNRMKKASARATASQ